MENKVIPILHTYMILMISMLLIAACIILNVSLFYGFFMSVFFSIMVLMIDGFSFSSLLGMIIKGERECSSIFLIILLVGSIISIWIASGTVPTMVYYGFNYIKHTNYLLACFLISLTISVVMGTALGTISTIGIALLGIGKGLFIPTPLLLGAIISGAFVSDKISPISGLVNLTMKTTGVKYNDCVKHMFTTLIPTFVITSIIYYILGRNYVTEINTLKLNEYQSNISNSFFVSPILLLFPITVIFLAIIGVKIIPNMTFGLLGGIVVSFFLQDMPFKEIIKVILLGYRASTGMEELNSIFKGGGVLSMLEVILIILGAVALSSIFVGTNMIDPIINNMLSKVKMKGDLIARTGILSIVITIATCDQIVGMLLPGKLLQSKYEKLGINRMTLTRTISDTGIIIAPLIPWNVNAIIITVITGVTAIEYGPYAVLCYISPIITILFGYLGFTNTWKNEESKSLA